MVAVTVRSKLVSFSSCCTPLEYMANILLTFPHPLMGKFLNPTERVNYLKESKPRELMETNLRTFADAYSEIASYIRNGNVGVFHWSDFHLTWEFVDYIEPYNGWKFTIEVPEVTDEMYRWFDTNRWSPHNNPNG